MNFTSIGDLALTFQNRRQSVQMKSDLARLAHELASGQKSNLSTAIAGDYAPIVGLERDLKVMSAYITSTSEAGMFVTTQQTALEFIESTMGGLGSALLSAGNSEHSMIIQTTTVDAKQKFSAVVTALNTSVADRYVFSGQATDTPPLADATLILSALQTAVAAETTATGIEGVVDAWFDDVGGGFETSGYLGSAAAMAPFRLSESDTASVQLTASDQNVRSILKGFALSALVGEGALNSNPTERAALARIAGEQVLNAEYSLTEIRARIGTSEAHIDTAAAKNSAQKAALEIARTEITAVDPYRTAVELETVQNQLETLYTVTARLSRLSLAEFLR
ncbi:MAG: flagellin [Paracoccaceae bacterium]